MPKAKSSSAQRRQRKEELRRQRRQERLAKRTGADTETLGRAVLEEMAEEMRQQGNLPDAEIRFNPPGQRKMSEVLRELIGPYEGATTNLEQLEKLVALATMAWNAALLPPKEQVEFLEKAMDAFPRALRADAADLLASLMLRKMVLFPDDQRYIVNARITDLDDQYHLAVASLTPGEET